MKTQYLETFVRVAESGSFSKAARELFTTPAALAQQINALEREVGTLLLDRDFRGVALTDAGRSYCDYAKEIVRLVQEGKEVANRVSGGRREVIRFAVYRDIARVTLRKMLADYAETHPEVTISFVNGDYHAFLDKMAAGEIDMFLFPRGSELDGMGLGFQKIYATGLSCNVAFDHPLAGKAVLTLDDLHGQDVIIGCGCGSSALDGFRAMIEKEHPQINVHRFATEDEVWDHVLMNGYLLVNLDFSSRYMGSCASVPLDWSGRVDYGFVYRKPSTPGIREFLDFAAHYPVEG